MKEKEKFLSRHYNGAKEEETAKPEKSESKPEIVMFNVSVQRKSLDGKDLVVFAAEKGLTGEGRTPIRKEYTDMGTFVSECLQPFLNESVKEVA